MHNAARMGTELRCVAAEIAEPPPASSVQRWAFDYIHAATLEYKQAPAAAPRLLLDDWPAMRVSQPRRPLELRPLSGKAKTPGREALREPKRRAALLHTFWHHELQAAELMCWALLAFPETPPAFRRGLLQICQDEIRHMQLYAREIAQLGYKIGDFPIRDWFWSRVPSVRTPSGFVAVMGLGFEAGNLDHAPRFAERFRAVGDERGAAMQELVAREEVSHVAFAAHWFRHFEGGLCFERWSRALPSPLSPMLMRGSPIDRIARGRAGIDGAFLDALERWRPVSHGT